MQRIVLTNNHQANDTYANANNDPDSYLKTAAYLDAAGTEPFKMGQAIVVSGTAMVGWSGLSFLASNTGCGRTPANTAILADDDPAWQKAEWRPCVIQPSAEKNGAAVCRKG